MSEKNLRSDARILIKRISDFNIANNYYQKDLKDEIARDFKKLLEIDDPTTRKFLERWLNIVTKEVARDFDLLGTEVEVDKAEEEKTTEEEGAEKDATEEEEAKDKEGEEAPTEEETSTEEVPEKPTKEEIPSMPENVVYKHYINRANDLMLDVLEE